MEPGYRVTSVIFRDAISGITIHSSQGSLLSRGIPGRSSGYADRGSQSTPRDLAVGAVLKHLQRHAFVQQYYYESSITVCIAPLPKLSGYRPAIFVLTSRKLSIQPFNPKLTSGILACILQPRPAMHWRPHWKRAFQRGERPLRDPQRCGKPRVKDGNTGLSAVDSIARPRSSYVWQEFSIQGPKHLLEWSPRTAFLLRG
ncbi:hypothetical protein FHL15_010840 [Xylaria flabelliformis]|uniref:Uncharacterized protein n=1 Tax=Xylaria flabelliformis TaxID=2512241 RepID=A0A553HK11_9PEZI|nr:hypothetical protein FHL15_010840 [Xylaria flabelliformis]